MKISFVAALCHVATSRFLNDESADDASRFRSRFAIPRGKSRANRDPIIVKPDNYEDIVHLRDDQPFRVSYIPRTVSSSCCSSSSTCCPTSLLAPLFNSVCAKQTVRSAGV